MRKRASERFRRKRWIPKKVATAISANDACPCKVVAVDWVLPCVVVCSSAFVAGGAPALGSIGRVAGMVLGGGDAGPAGRTSGIVPVGACYLGARGLLLTAGGRRERTVFACAGAVEGSGRAGACW